MDERTQHIFHGLLLRRFLADHYSNNEELTNEQFKRLYYFTWAQVGLCASGKFGVELHDNTLSIMCEYDLQ